MNFTGQPVRRGEPLFALYSPMVVHGQQELLLARRLAGEVAGGTPRRGRGARRTCSNRPAAACSYWDVPPARDRAIERTGEVRTDAHPPLAGDRGRDREDGARRASGSWRASRSTGSPTSARSGSRGRSSSRTCRRCGSGSRSTAEFQALPGERSHGPDHLHLSDANPETRTARVRVELREPGPRASSPGCTPPSASRRRPRRCSACRAPPCSSTGERNLVFVQRADGALEPREVTLGRRDRRPHRDPAAGSRPATPSSPPPRSWSMPIEPRLRARRHGRTCRAWTSRRHPGPDPRADGATPDGRTATP